MLRVFLFLLIVLLLGFGFSWFADRPGEVVLQWQGSQYETTLMVVLSAIVGLVAAIMFLWWVARSILDSPRLLRRFWQNRKRDRGYHALSQGLIAANSGDAAAARRFSKESVKLLGHEPLVDLLDAQTSLLEGKREIARERFEEMLKDDATRLVALRGLYLEAERQGAGEAARHYAEEAHKSAPSLPWAGNAMLRYRVAEGDWEGALSALEANRAAGLIDKEQAKRHRAVLLTARAMAVEPSDPASAAKHAREAHKLAPDFVPAAVIGAAALSRNNDIGRAAGMLETVWKKNPHPEIAEAYVHLRVGDAAADRLKRARKLAAMRANHAEGNLAVAEAAIEAHDWKAAREAMKPVMTTTPTERACLIMADIEEGEFGDKGRMRDWLARAVRAPRDAAWTADGHVSEKWLPISPITGRIDAFEWKVPVELLDAPKAETLDAEGIEALLSDPPIAPVADASGPEAVQAAGRAGAMAASTVAATAGAGAIATTVTGEAAEEAASGEQAGPEADVAPVSDSEAQEASRSADGGSGSDEQDGGSEAGADHIDPVPVAANTQDAPSGDLPAADGNGETVLPGSGREEAVEAEIIPADAADEAANVTAEVAEEIVSEPPVTTGAASRSAGWAEDGAEEEEEEDVFPLKRRPDDPGVDENAEPEEKPRRFGLF